MLAGLLLPLLLLLLLTRIVCLSTAADDSVFYDNPRFVYHIDESAVKALTE